MRCIMKKILAIDGGGTKTELILFNENMEILQYKKTGPTNFNEKPEEAAKTLAQALKGIKADAVFAGIAGALNRKDDIAKIFTDAELGNVQIESDLMNIMLGELGNNDGCCVICGTGSACYAKRGSTYKRIGGWGYLIDTGGSGFDIGRDGLEAILKSIDGRGPYTEIERLFKSQYGCTPDSMLSQIYNKGKSLIADYSRLVFDAVKLKDEIAIKIIDRNMSVLAEYIDVARRYIKKDSIKTILTGGVFAHEQYAYDTLLKLTENTELVISSIPQICGAAIGARAVLGFDTSEEQINILLEDYYARTNI